MSKVESKIIVLDDDPTGSQTVHSCLLLTRWDVETLRDALTDASPLFFVLTNTRGMDVKAAANITREVCVNLKQAMQELKESGREITPIMVSRSDSTLRGHYPVETDVIAEELQGFDAHFLVPAFFEGGRITRNATHYLVINGEEVPVHETEFAKDSVFGYSHSYLPKYVEEKTGARINADQVIQFTLADVRGNCLDKLIALHNNQCCTVDAETQADLDNFCRQVNTAVNMGKRFLFRSGASLLTSMSQLPKQPVAATSMAQYVRQGKAGVVLVGSHVQKSSEQLSELLKQENVVSHEVDVELLETQYERLLDAAIYAAHKAQDANRSLVIYTSRVEKQFPDQQLRLQFGMKVSALLMDIVRRLPSDIGFLISKGGITSNDVLSHGLALQKSRVLGQILAGCSVVRCPDEHPRYPGLPVVIFPGNVGDKYALVEVFKRLTGGDGA